MAAALKALEGHLSYTVGWIAPLPIERAAAKATFDEEHSKPVDFEQPRGDPNSYSWGRIGDHNIVLASLKAHSYGTTSAASSATSMLRSFPEIRFGLLVGIGGAIPRLEHDIRLGDIVVSQPSGSAGGVIQYDLRKAKSGGVQERKDFLDSPPEVLLHALANLQSQHEEEPSRVSEFLQEMEKRKPYMFTVRPSNPGYKCPDQSEDRLFLSAHEHQGGLDCRSCASEYQEPRIPRQNTAPIIHYGVIASGNALVKDASVREELLQHIPIDCLCYEMEAAGLMNNFPCLVIRGISDYSDSHKNDIWQRYAAATAAAFSKELLGYVSAVGVRREQKALDALDKKISTLQGTVSDVKEVVVHSQKRREIEDVIAWLSPADTRTSHARAKNERADGSCTWFLQGEPFRRWKSAPGSFLWLHGIVGCGKTVLSSAIIEDLTAEERRPHHIVLYFYFDFNSATWNLFDGMVRTFLCQIVSAKSEIPESLWHRFEFCRRQSKHPETQSLLEAFHSMISLDDDVRIVMDALDEVKEEYREAILSWVEKTFSIQENRISSIVLSRHVPLFESVFKRIGPVVSIPRDDVDHDIQQYIQTRLKDSLSKGWALPFHETQKIESTLIRKANGMFRLAALQIDSLQRCGMPRELQEAIQSLPDSLTEIYNDIISRICPERKKAAIRLLQLLAYAKRPLRLDEVADAIVVDLNKSPSFRPDQRMFTAKSLLDYCPGLLILEESDSQLSKESPLDGYLESLRDLQVRSRKDAESGRLWFPNSLIRERTERKATYLPSRHCRVFLAHFSVTEYLRSNKMRTGIGEEFEESHVHAIFVELSLKYLMSLSTIRSDSSVSAVRRDYPFSDYASSFWPQHAKACEQTQSTQDLVVRYLTNPQAFRTWLFVFKPEHGYQYRRSDSVHREICLSDRGIEIPSPLQVATKFELSKAVKTLLDLNVSLLELDTSSDCDKYGHDDLRAFHIRGSVFNPGTTLFGPFLRTGPLYTAVHHGWEDIVWDFVHEGFSIHDHSGPEGSAFTVACVRGHEKLVAWVIAADTGQDRQDSQYGPGVRQAFIHGNWKVLQSLVDAGAKFPPSQSSEVQTDALAFSDMSKYLHWTLNSFVLERNSWVECPIGQSIVKNRMRSRGTLQSLMECSAPFVMANSESHRVDAIMQLDGAVSGFELHNAVKIGDTAFLSAILPRWKSKFKVHDKRGKSPLHYAGKTGDVHIIRILLSAEFSLEDTDKMMRRPLSYALMNDRLHVLDLLSPSRHSIEQERARLQRQAEILAAIDMENLPKPERLYGAKANVFFVQKNTAAIDAFRYAVLSESTSIIDFMLSEQQDPLFTDANGRKPYVCALESGNIHFLKAFPLDYRWSTLYLNTPDEYARELMFRNSELAGRRAIRTQ